MAIRIAREGQPVILITAEGPDEIRRRYGQITRATGLQIHIGDLSALDVQDADSFAADVAILLDQTGQPS